MEFTHLSEMSNPQDYPFKKFDVKKFDVKAYNGYIDLDDGFCSL